MSDPRLWYDFPNERLICQLCVEWVDFEDLYEDESGNKWDMCKACGPEPHVVGTREEER